MAGRVRSLGRSLVSTANRLDLSARVDCDHGASRQYKIVVRRLDETRLGLDPQDLDLMKVIDEPEAIVEAIFDFYESRGFQPTREEREKMLNL